MLVYIVIDCAFIGQRCANERCLLATDKCDGVNNCGDYSDETDCSMFIFTMLETK